MKPETFTPADGQMVRTPGGWRVVWVMDAHECREVASAMAGDGWAEELVKAAAELDRRNLTGGID